MSFASAPNFSGAITAQSRPVPTIQRASARALFSDVPAGSLSATSSTCRCHGRRTSSPGNPPHMAQAGAVAEQPRGAQGRLDAPRRSAAARGETPIAARPGRPRCCPGPSSPSRRGTSRRQGRGRCAGSPGPTRRRGSASRRRPSAEPRPSPDAGVQRRPASRDREAEARARSGRRRQAAPSGPLAGRWTARSRRRDGCWPSRHSASSKLPALAGGQGALPTRAGYGLSERRPEQQRRGRAYKSLRSAGRSPKARALSHSPASRGSEAQGVADQVQDPAALAVSKLV